MLGSGEDGGAGTSLSPNLLALEKTLMLDHRSRCGRSGILCV